MVKVKRIVACGNERFEDRINEFIAGKVVIDIKYSSGVLYERFNNYGSPTRIVPFDRALIIYEDYSNV